MDGALFWILLLVFYFLLQGLGGRKTKQQGGSAESQSSSSGTSPTSPSGTSTASTAPNRELDDALGEIRDLLGGGPQQRPEREQRNTQRKHPSEPRQSKTRQSKPREARRERNRLSTRATSTSGFGGSETAEKISEQQEKMEEMAKRMRDGSSIKDALDIEHIDIPSHEEMRKRDRSGISQEMLNRLRDAASAREGVLIAEVLGPPRARYSNLKRLGLLKR